MRKRIFAGMAAIALLTALAAAVLCAGLMYVAFDRQAASQLWEEAEYMAAVLNREAENQSYLTTLVFPGGAKRVTWVDEQGQVLYDSAADAQTLPNHSDRQEIRQAQYSGRGESLRHSATLREDIRYCALRLADGTVIRLAQTQKSIWALSLQMMWPLLALLAALLAATFLFAGWLTRRIIRPLNRLNIDHPLANSDAYDELAPLLNRLEKQNRQIQNQLEELRGQQEKLSAITENMREGLVVLDEGGQVLSINESALALFHRSREEALHQPVLTLNRSPALQKAVSRATAGDYAEELLPLNGRSCLLMASPVQERGTVLLLLDVTEKQDAEIMRREFSANVSHELKTPLTAIMGYAEIMANGVAQPKDAAAFAGRIHQEAQRLIDLVQDIIRLSHLDEAGETPPLEPVDLWALMQECAQRLAEQAKARGVEIVLSGDRGVIWGLPQVAEEIIYNLIDNAIRYNVPSGRVEAEVFQESGRVALTVADTGIGIAPEHQEKVFERFYRVDKSHSKATGGTGLGLSIVKHGVKLMNGLMTLKSKPGRGTVIRIVFPAAL